MRLFGLIGYPLGHSFSAAYFTRKFRDEGINAVYNNYPLKHIDDFKNLVKGEPGLAGLNVTVPYKQEVTTYLDSMSATAAEIGAVNTITFRRRDGHVLLEGDNTDVIGFGQSLEQHLGSSHNSALVLGTGGSSKAVLYVLKQLNIDCTQVSRTPGMDRITYNDLDRELVTNTPLIINTTPLGMLPNVESCPDLPYEALTSSHLLFDLVYNPAKTEFLSRGEKQGAKVVNGYDMLVLQAEGSWRIWTGDN